MFLRHGRGGKLNFGRYRDPLRSDFVVMMNRKRARCKCCHQLVSCKIERMLAHSKKCTGSSLEAEPENSVVSSSMLLDTSTANQASSNCDSPPSCAYIPTPEAEGDKGSVPNIIPDSPSTSSVTESQSKAAASNFITQSKSRRTLLNFVTMTSEEEWAKFFTLHAFRSQLQKSRN